MTRAKTYFLNPVKGITDSRQLIAASVIFIFSLLICYLLHIANDGIFHGIFDAHQSILLLLTSNFLVVFVPALLLFIAGKCFNKGTRLLDMWNTVLFSRLPIILGYALAFSLTDQSLLAALSSRKLAPQTIPKQELVRLSIIGFMVVPFLVYSIILLINGYKTSMYAKKPIHYVLLGIGIIVSELVYRILIYPIIDKL